MKFSTISPSPTNGGAYRIYPGATFDLEYDHCGDKQSWLLPPTHTDFYSDHTQRDQANGLRISNELLASPDVILRPVVRYGNEGKYSVTRFELTVLKAALRVAKEWSVLVPESEADRCESKVSAHALWFHKRWGLPGQFQLIPGAAGCIHMSHLAIIPINEPLTVNIVEKGTKGGTMFKTGEPYTDILRSFTVDFDGTNICVEGAPVERPGQLCFA